MTRYIKILTFVLYASFPVVLTSCGGDDDGNPAPSYVKLEKGEVLNELSKNDLAILLQFSGYGALQSYLEYDVKVYSITYKTDYLGKEIVASGLVGFPKTSDPMPMMSYQHGTIVSHNDAPSVDTQVNSLFAGMASAGYIFLMPDYIGFGSSAHILHPYYRADPAASSVIDMLIATRELAAREGFNFDGKVFLSGYSEGGYVTMATHRAMEQEAPKGFELVASAPAAGGYDIKGMQEYFFSLDTYNDPYYIAYVALSYKTTYGWGQPLSDFFQEPYATDIPDYFDGSLSGSQINNHLPEKVVDFIEPEFLATIDTNPKYTDIVNAFYENSLTGWVPENTMFMYHGTADVTVPYQNTIDTYESMIAEGVSTDHVLLIPLEGATHSSGAVPYLLDVVARFDALK
ncbi:hypothetical protein C900_01163 [Fulvivirga imtechensis AK7]|uniref:Peptidase S9 prolyl oligopeptidase catalytic domain-containing protein n=1 Tax=Fulvivirga imtechensis AK7 TaxID=1237149 RepID=L8JKP7_9BACT|nr:prolyl oligopeptidase family serine peptidase [Fulvivirga imtechensis]ELR68084.1 hypothetical protein C900_01163 [Fulvivirga imtechensis AK7]